MSHSKSSALQCDQKIRNLMLYPFELRAHVANLNQSDTNPTLYFSGEGAE